jgi:hypothetical protein
MRIIFGVLLPLLLQVPACIWLIFGSVIKVPGGSFVPLGAMLLAPVLVLGTVIFNFSLATRSKNREDSLDWIFFRGAGIALMVPVILALVILLGSAVLD